MSRNPVDIWNSEIPEAIQIALKDTVLRVARDSFAVCAAAFPGYPINYAVGQWRFTAMQVALLEFGTTDPILKSRCLFHDNGLPYTQLYTPKLQVTYATVESPGALPQMSFLREEEQSQQLEFFKDASPLVCHLCLSFEHDRSAPYSAGIHFPNGHGGYLNQVVDLLQKRQPPTILPQEKVDDSDEPRDRHEKGREDDQQA